MHDRARTAFPEREGSDRMIAPADDERRQDDRCR
jgi:hypothetical protein